MQEEIGQIQPQTRDGKAEVRVRNNYNQSNYEVFSQNEAGVDKMLDRSQGAGHSAFVIAITASKSAGLRFDGRGQPQGSGSQR